MVAAAVRVLLVDDNAGFVAVLTALLQSNGFDVVACAHNGADAVEAAERTQPEVVTMDLDMPVSDGVAAIRTIVALGIPVVVVTGSDSSERADQAIAAGATALVGKPDIAATLSQRLREVVGE